jgi:hypothetical protein
MKVSDMDEGTIEDELLTDDGSIFLRITPLLNEEGEWDTSLDISLIVPDGGPLTDSEKGILLNMAFCIAASVPLYEQDDAILQRAKEILYQAQANGEGDYLFGDIDGDAHGYEDQGNEPKSRVEGISGNVVHVSFNRTKGGK